MELPPELAEAVEVAKLKEAVASERELQTVLKRQAPPSWQGAAFERRQASLALAEGRVFKPIPGYPGYAISSDGVLSAPTRGGNRIFKYPAKTYKKGKYPHYYIKGKYYLCHHLVMLTWGEPKPFEGAYLRHIDDDPNNFSISNLAWGTGKDNYRDFIINHYDEWRAGRAHHKQKLKVEQVIEILKRLDSGEQGSKIAREFGLSNRAIYSIKEGKTWNYVREQIYPALQQKLKEVE